MELHHVQETLNFQANEGTLDVFTIILPEIIAILLFLNPIPEIDSTLEVIIFRIGFYEDHFPNLRVHLEALSKLYNRTPLKIITTVLKTFQSQKNLRS